MVSPGPLGNSSANIPRELYASFAKLEAEFCAWSRKKGDTSGTCATMVVNAGDEIFVANAGDSKAIAFTDSGGRVKSVDLNPRHGAELPSERTRILNAGGAISEDGAVWVLACGWELRPVLTLARSCAGQ